MTLPSIPLAVNPWGTCPTCGDAVPANALRCPTCGKEQPLTRGERGEIAKRTRRRIVLHRWVRVLLVAVVVGGVAAAIVPSVLSGPTSYADPLTGTFGLTLRPSGFAYISGAITGEDYISGNFTVVAPPGALVTLTVLNASAFTAFEHGVPVRPTAPPTQNVSSARIVFDAPYTDTFFFVFSNPYPAPSGIQEEVYAATTYESNVVIG